MTHQDDDIESLARIWHAAKHRSRRAARAMLAEATGNASDEMLDATLRLIEQSNQFGEIKQIAAELEAARTEAALGAMAMTPGGDHPEWLVCETAPPGRTFLLHLCRGGSYSFLGEVFDEIPFPKETTAFPLDEGQWLANILWLDGEPPSRETLHALMDQARRQMRVYDQAADMEGEQ